MSELNKAIEILEGIAGAWNGKYETFFYNGDIYHEDQAHQINDALKILKGDE